MCKKWDEKITLKYFFVFSQKKKQNFNSFSKSTNETLKLIIFVFLLKNVQNINFFTIN